MAVFETEVLLGVSKKKLHLETGGIYLQDVPGVLGQVGAKEELVPGGFVGLVGEDGDDPQFGFEFWAMDDGGVEIGGWPLYWRSGCLR